MLYQKLGGLDEREIQAALRILGIGMTTEEVRQIIAKVDDDRSGQIEFEEFASFLRENRLLVCAPFKKKKQEKQKAKEREI